LQSVPHAVAAGADRQPHWQVAPAHGLQRQVLALASWFMMVSSWVRCAIGRWRGRNFPLVPRAGLERKG
jgi:hypothetical protein